NFIYIEVDEDLSFLPKEAYPGFKIGSTSVLVNTEPLKADEELVIQPAEVMTYFKENMKPKLFVVHPGSVAARIKDMKCKIIITIFLIMSAKDSIATQTCELLKEEFNDFLTLYPIPSEYRVILPKSNQTIFDAPPGAYGYEPSVDLFRGFFNLCRAGKWLTFTKRSVKHVPNLLPKFITRIEGWHERFFYVQDSIIPAKYSQILSKKNKLDSKSFKDKLPLNIEKNSMFQYLG
nr:hypothetical protein [Tanacetum cinerariifolium]